MSDLQLFLQHLKQPEYVHILLNPWPVYGMAAGAFMLGFSMLLRSQRGQIATLVWLVLMGAAAGLAILYGHKGYDRVYAMSEMDAQQWLDVHVYRVEMFQYVFYATGLAALAGLALMRRWPKISQVCAGLALFLSLLSASAAGWISQAGGQVRHTEFREGPPRPDQLPSKEERHSHDHEHGTSESAPAEPVHKHPEVRGDH